MRILRAFQMSIIKPSISLINRVYRTIFWTGFSVLPQVVLHTSFCISPWGDSRFRNPRVFPRGRDTQNSVYFLQSSPRKYTYPLEVKTRGNSPFRVNFHVSEVPPIIWNAFPVLNVSIKMCSFCRVYLCGYYSSHRKEPINVEQSTILKSALQRAHKLDRINKSA